MVISFTWPVGRISPRRSRHFQFRDVKLGEYDLNRHLCSRELTNSHTFFRALRNLTCATELTVTCRLGDSDSSKLIVWDGVC